MTNLLQDERKRGLGGTDISAILGVNPWRSPVDVFQEKTGRAAPIPDNPAMRAGRMLEPVIVQMYQEDTGLQVTTNLPFIRRDGILIGHLDGLVESAGRVWEAKTARHSDGWGAAGTDEIPLHYQAQVQWYCGLTELPAADVAVLIGGSDFRIYQVRADRVLFDELREAALRWWRDHIEADVPPPARSASDAAALWPRSQAREIEVGADLATRVQELAGIKGTIKDLQARADKIEEDVRLAFEDADTLTIGGQVLATYRSQSAMRFDQKAFAADHAALFDQYRKQTSSRVLRIK